MLWYVLIHPTVQLLFIQLVYRKQKMYLYFPTFVSLSSCPQQCDLVKKIRENCREYNEITAVKLKISQYVTKCLCSVSFLHQLAAMVSTYEDKVLQLLVYTEILKEMCVLC